MVPIEQPPSLEALRARLTSTPRLASALPSSTRPALSDTDSRAVRIGTLSALEPTTAVIT